MIHVKLDFKFYQHHRSFHLSHKSIFNMQVRICFNRRVGLGTEAVTHIPANTRVLHYQGNIISSEDAKANASAIKTHYATVRHTGCVIDGNMKALFGSGTRPIIGEIHQVPCELMSLTNSSQHHKLANCTAECDENDPREHKDGMWLNTTIWLVTTRDIQPFEELVWDYLVR